MVRVCVARVLGVLEGEKNGGSSISVTAFEILHHHHQRGQHHSHLHRGAPLHLRPARIRKVQKAVLAEGRRVAGRRWERICACMFVSLQRSRKDARVCDMIGCRCSLATPGYKTPAPWLRASVRIRGQGTWRTAGLGATRWELSPLPPKKS